MSEWKLFADGTVPEYTTAPWYEGRERAPHLEQAGHRDRLLLTSEFVKSLVRENQVASVSDFGCGDGGLLSLIKNDVRSWGYDLSREAVSGARARGVTAELLDVVNGSPVYGELTVVTEILEHLTDPHAFVSTIRDNSAYVVASSPSNESLGCHYEFHTWAWDFQGYNDLFTGNGWRVLKHQGVSSFQVIAAERA